MHVIKIIIHHEQVEHTVKYAKIVQDLSSIGVIDNINNKSNRNMSIYLGRPLEEGMATHSSVLAWKIP